MARPTATRPIAAFGFVDDFEGNDTLANEEDYSADISDGKLVVTVKQIGATPVFTYKEDSSNGKAIKFSVSIAGTSGWGDVVLRLSELSDDALWDFAVNPFTQSWMLYRRSIYTGELFVWVEPRSYAGVSEPVLRTVEVRLSRGKPVLFINGEDVVSPTGVPMPEISGSVTVGLGAGIDPNLAPSNTPWFVAEFSQARLEQL